MNVHSIIQDLVVLLNRVATNCVMSLCRETITNTVQSSCVSNVIARESSE